MDAASAHTGKERAEKSLLEAARSTFFGSIDRRLILTGAGLVLVAGLAGIALIGALLRDLEESRIGKNAPIFLEAVSSHLTADLDGLIDRGVIAAQVIAASQDGGNTDIAHLVGSLRQLLDDNPGFARIELVLMRRSQTSQAGRAGQSNMVALAATPDMISVPSDRSEVANAINALGGGRIGLVPGSRNGAPGSDAKALTLRVPIRADGEVIGALAFGFVESPLATAARTAESLGSRLVVWRDPAQLIFGDPEIFAVMSERLTSPTARPGEIPAPGRVVELLRGRERLLTETQSLGLPRIGEPWRATLVFPYSLIDNVIWLLVAKAAMITLGLSLIAAVLFMSIGRSIGRPMALFVRAVQGLAAGNVDIVLPTRNRDDELGDMARWLGILRDHALERRRLYDLQAVQLEEIEQRVAERTTELSAALDTLHRTKDELVQSEKLAALGGMVAAIAHEVNTPIGNAQVVATTIEERITTLQRMIDSGQIKKSTVQEIGGTLKEACGLLVKSLQRASELVRSFKEVAVDRTSERRRSFAVASVVEDIATTLRIKYRHQRQEIKIELSPALMLDSFPGPLSQVVGNLIENAYIHAFPDNREGEIAISGRLDGDMMVIEVSDTGTGIPPSALPNIFDPFFTTRLGRGGSGLGLHICYNILTGLLHGTIRAENRPEGGATFILRIPTEPKPGEGDVMGREEEVGV